MENVESIRIRLKEIICLLEVCRLSSSSSYAHGLEAIIDLCNLNPPPLHQVHKAGSLSGPSHRNLCQGQFLGTFHSLWNYRQGTLQSEPPSHSGTVATTWEQSTISQWGAQLQCQQHPRCTMCWEGEHWISAATFVIIQTPPSARSISDMGTSSVLSFVDAWHY